MASVRKISRIVVAAVAYAAAVVATVFIIDTVQKSPIDHNQLGLWVVVAALGIGVGSLLVRRPRI